MGCGSSNNRNIFQLLGESDLRKEAFGYGMKECRGLKIDQYNQIATQKVINANNPLFKEEIIDHADESGSVKPWLTNIVPPADEIEENKDSPPYSLKIAHVFGFRSSDVRQNLFFIGNDKLVYMASGLGIIQDVDGLSQSIFGGYAYNDNKTSHDNDIMSIAFYHGEVSMVATGQRGLKPVILIWSPIDTSVIYYKFHQTRGSKEVASLAFDKEGQYVASYGKGQGNPFFVFNIQSKSLYWTAPTGDNVLFDLQFNPTNDEFCVVGIHTVIFFYLSRKLIKHANTKFKNIQALTFTAICYTSTGVCVIGSEKGITYFFQEGNIIKELNLTTGSVQSLTYNTLNDRIYLSDSLKFVYILKSTDTHPEVQFEMPSIVKALDVNEYEDMAIGMKDGSIMIKNVKEKKDIYIARSHYEGKVGGLEFISDKYAITTGEDNRIMLWNLRTETCEAIGSISEKILNSNNQQDKQNEVVPNVKGFGPNQCSKAVAYNKEKDHIAIGVNNGTVSIRKGLKFLDVRAIPDIQIGNKPITELKYSHNNQYLAVASEDLDFVILNVNTMYTVLFRLNEHESHILRLDWDRTDRYIQAITKDNSYLFYDITTQGIIQDPTQLRQVLWPSFTCKFGYTVQGVYMGSTDPDFITCVCKANTKNIIASGDDDLYLNLYNYPTISENPKVKSYLGHTDHIERIAFSQDDTKLISIAGYDKSVILWSVTQE